MILCETNSMEVVMSNKTITHEVKLQKSVIVILGIMAFGLCANVFAPVFKVEEAMAGIGVQKVTICNPSGRKCGDNWVQLVRQN